jgi:hypothetical protein
MPYNVSADRTAFIFRVKLTKQWALNPKDEGNSILQKIPGTTRPKNGVTFEKAWTFKVILNFSLSIPRDENLRNFHVSRNKVHIYSQLHKAVDRQEDYRCRKCDRCACTSFRE